jgi:Domain of unknown function (DUF6268)
MRKIKLLNIVFFLFITSGFAQPYTDIVSFTYQRFSSKYKNTTSLQNQTDNYSLNLLYPKKLKNNNVILFRLNSETINSAITSESVSSSLTSIAIPIGFQWVSKSKKWKTTILGIPKMASDFENKITSKDWQFGGYFLENYSLNPNLKLKLGLYYNKEAFGNFFVPLLGVDWKASDKLQFYGTLPTNYKVEYNLIKDKWFTGIDFKSVTRSFNITTTNQQNYVRFDELLLKAFAECFIYKNVLLSSEIGYSFGKNPLQYDSNSDNLSAVNGIYSPLQNYFIFNIGISYRIRNE